MGREWRERLRGEAIRADFGEFTLRYHVSLRPAHPPEYDVPGRFFVTKMLERCPQEVGTGKMTFG